MIEIDGGDLVAIVALIAAPIGTYFVSSLIFTRQATAERERARVARVQANRAATYVDVLDHVYRTMAFVDRTHPLMSVAGDPPAPSFPSDDDLRRLNARVAAFGSENMLGWLAAFRDAVQAWQFSVWAFESKERGFAEGNEALEARKAMEEKRTAAREQFKGLLRLANNELHQ